MTFCYAPLNTNGQGTQFRILHLLPGQPSNGVRCCLHQLGLDGNVSYDALSYTWGDLKGTKEISCDGHTLRVTTNLHTALRRVRSTTEVKHLWADGVCINQQDVNERGKQVQLMKSIFSNAKCVLIWLGEEDETSHRALELIGDLAKSVDRFLAEGGDMDDVDFNDPLAEKHFSCYKNLEQFTRLAALNAFTHRTWFARVWVVQEVSMAARAEIIYEDLNVDWEDFTVATKAYDNLNLHMVDHERVARAREEWLSGTHLELLSLLFRYRAFGATDPRDKIYGLDALTLHKHEALKVDYNIDVATLYRAVAKDVLQTEMDLTILSVPKRFAGDIIVGLPSWCPDWSSTRLCPGLGLAHSGNRPADIHDMRYNAGGGSCLQEVHLRDNDTALGIDAVILDEIAAIGPVLMTDRVPRTVYGSVRIPKCSFALADWTATAGLLSSTDSRPYVTGEPLADALMQTLVAQSTTESTEALRKDYSILQNFAALARLARWIPAFTPSFVAESMVSVAHRRLFGGKSDTMSYDFRVGLSCLTDRRVFRTAKGYIGLAGALVEVGDRVAVARGGKVPYVLREAEGGWTLKSDCYLRGIMNGEAYDESQLERLWLV
ncbi:hypothetical protein LTR95_003465 [Oleoguttula sp. CCFEE 5521]